ncbi:MAG: FtsX-like permease family protein [Bacteroidota bacterium]
MNLPLKIARRYLFSKKSTNAINVISGISVFGIVVGSAALILVLSVFNGFGDLISGLYNAFNPDVKITAVEGKVFTPDPDKMLSLNELKGVYAISETLEENAMFDYDGNKDFGRIKGVDNNFVKVTSVDTTVIRGHYALTVDEIEYAVIGLGMEGKLAVNIGDMFTPLKVYMPKRKKVTGLQDPLKRGLLRPAGTYAIQNDFDGQYIITSLAFAREILSYNNNEVSSLEMKLQPGADSRKVIKAIKEIMGEDFEVKNRYQQDEAFFKIMNIEKWIAYVILSFTLLLVAFNMVGSLWLLVIEKKQDIAILKSMGATSQLVRNIFLSEGLLLSLLGVGIGFFIAVSLCLLQQRFGLIMLQSGDSFLVDAYPVSMKLRDFILVFVTVLVIGSIASLLPAMRAARIEGVVRGE